VLAALPYYPERCFEIPLVIERIEDPENIDPRLRRLLDEGLDDVVGIVAVPDEILASQQHLQGSLLYTLFQLYETFPWILIEESCGHIERCPTPYFH